MKSFGNEAKLFVVDMIEKKESMQRFKEKV